MYSKRLDQTFFFIRDRFLKHFYKTIGFYGFSTFRKRSYVKISAYIGTDLRICHTEHLPAYSFKRKNITEAISQNELTKKKTKSPEPSRVI